jgi:phosphoglycerol transferase MdoB-like AlkP superfamily enzyme
MTDRYDDGLIISVGDHGQTVENSVNEKGHYSRLINLPLSVLRPIFLMKPPQGLPDDMTQSLARNSGAVIANIDIAPTIAHVLGVTPKVDDLSYEGFSLFADIPATRIAYTLNVNHWRSWDRGCVAISRGNARVTVDYQTEDLCVYSSREPEEDEASRYLNKEKLLLEGLSQEILRNAISRIFRDKLGMYRRPGSGNERDVSAGGPKVRADRQGASSGPQA